MKKRELQLLMPVQDNPYYKDNPKYFLELKNLVECNPIKFGQILRSKGSDKRHPDKQYLFNWILEKLPLLSDAFYTVPTKCYWILNGLIDFPICPICGKSDNYRNKNVKTSKGYTHVCSRKCKTANFANEYEKTKKTKLERYGDENYNNVQQIQETCLKLFGSICYFSSDIGKTEIKQIKLEKYDDENYSNREKAKQTVQKNKAENPNYQKNISEKIAHTKEQKKNADPNYLTNALKKSKQTRFERYGDENFVNPQKTKKTKLERYGDENYNNMTQIKQTCLIRYGVTSVLLCEDIQDKITASFLKHFGVKRFSMTQQWKDLWNDDEWKHAIVSKQFATKRQRKTFSTSMQEDKCYDILCDVFEQNMVLRQYSSDKYPFNCDFYIKSLDLYIECNFHWTHSGHFFDAANLDDQMKVQKWKDKGTKFYDNAVNTWTVRDVKKQQTAIDNSLNYLVFWSMQEFLTWIQQLPEVNKTITT